MEFSGGILQDGSGWLYDMGMPQDLQIPNTHRSLIRNPHDPPARKLALDEDWEEVESAPAKRKSGQTSRLRIYSKAKASRLQYIYAQIPKFR